MKRIVSILILAYPILVFADKIYFKDDTSIEGEIIDYKGNYITFQVGNIMIFTLVIENILSRKLIFKHSYLIWIMYIWQQTQKVKL